MRVPDEIAGEAAPDRGPGENLDRTIRRLARRPAVRGVVHAGPGATLWFAGGVRHDP